jgi:hypothetical protein
VTVSREPQYEHCKFVAAGFAWNEFPDRVAVRAMVQKPSIMALQSGTHRIQSLQSAIR